MGICDFLPDYPKIHGGVSTAQVEKIKKFIAEDFGQIKLKTFLLDCL